MKSTYKIIWSEEALSGLKEIISYLEMRFSEKEIRKFIIIFDKQLDLIRSNPQMFPLSSRSKNVRRSIIGKLTSLYYFVDQDAVKIIAIHDNRKNPDNLKIHR